MPGIDLSIIIVTYNSADSIADCIESIRKWTVGLNYEIIIIDNKSTDDTLKVVSRLIDIKVVPNEENLGFASASNAGAVLAKGKILLFLNPDVCLESNSLRSAVDFMNRHADTGIAGCQLFYPNGTPQHSFFKYHTVTGLISRYFKVYKVLPRNRLTEPLFYFYPDPIIEPIEVDWVLGADLFIREKIFKEIGGFDTGYFMYCEDTDLCLKVKQLGYKIYGLPFKLIHKFAGSSEKVLEKRIIYSRDSVNTYMRRYFRKHQYVLGYTVVLLNVLLKMLLCFGLSVITFWKFKTLWLKGKGYYNAVFIRRQL